MGAVPLGASLGQGTLDVEGVCTEAGMTCLNCTHAITCIPLPVGWLKVPLQQCPEGQSCNAHQRQCTTAAVPECDAAGWDYHHTCEQVGIFPDAFDCRKFHLCSPPADLPDGAPADHRAALCPRNYGYDPKTAQCSIPLKRGQCEQKPVPTCKKVGDFGVLPSSPHYYFVCLSKKGVISPQVFLCPHGWYFWDSFCRPEPETEATVVVDTVQSTTESSRPNVFFSTEKTTTYAADTFLADKFDMNNYESIDETPNTDDFTNSFETEDFWQMI
ncbi:uncharacterized protein LOC121732742 [Aricia agestis]|uniref:uncharacterized protein LOC121732742 n=1 Tax=Aricia agestis TaxID=91739 RepID=UPI001C20762E|nr:uncharacterized protein LOC121732742 [Aricia agestis]